jgi:ketosteroid isomerase-like protein
MHFFNKILLLLLLSGLLQSTAFAQSKAVAEVEKAVESLRTAMISGNPNDLSQITTKDLTYGHSGGKVEHQAQFIAAFVSGASDFTAITLSDQTVTVTGKTAIVRHTLSGETHDAGKAPGTVKLHILLVFVKEKKAWKLLARQAVKIP